MYAQSEPAEPARSKISRIIKGDDIQSVITRACALAIEKLQIVSLQSIALGQWKSRDKGMLRSGYNKCKD